MDNGLKKAGALVLCGALVTVFAPACDLQYTCEPVEQGARVQDPRQNL